MKETRQGAETIVPRRGRSSFATVWVCTCCLLAGFGILAMLLIARHTVADWVLAKLPAPGPATSMATARSLTSHLRIEPPRVWRARLGDNSETLVAETTVTNDSFIAVRDVVVEAEAYLGGRKVGSAISACGKALSPTLLGRIKRDELATVLDLPASGTTLMPGSSTSCQVAFPRSAARADEIEIRVASVEPLPGHREARFLVQE